MDGAGSRRVLDPMWPRVRELVDDALAVPIAEAAAAVRLLAARAHVVAEGAGALATAAALRVEAGTGKVVCIVSGGNIDPAKLAAILQGVTLTRERGPARARPARRGASDYERYLRTDELLSLQKPPEERVHHDELLFQTVHQSSELWLKLGHDRGRRGRGACSSETRSRRPSG